MHKFATWMLALLAAPAASAAVPHVELTTSYRPIARASNNMRLAATNFGPGTAYVMSYHTAFALPEGRTTGRWLLVRDGTGSEVGYKGRWVLTRTPGPSSYRSIAPGETITSDIDLATEYALPEAGTISVSSVISVLDRIPGLDAMGEPENVPNELVQSSVAQFAVTHATR